MAITPGPGYQVDPNNPNGVIPLSTSSPTVPLIPTPQQTQQQSVATPVVSSKPAAAALGGMQQTTTQAQQAISDANDARIKNQGKPGYDVFGNPVAGTPNAGGGAVSVPTTPEQTIADTPDANHQWIYDASGNRTQIAIGQTPPAGYSTTNPKVEPTTPVTDTAQTSLYLYKQYQDGTYGRYSLDQNGNYTYAGSATQLDFTGAQAEQKGTQALQTILSGGSLPLTPIQQAQIAGLQATWQAAIEVQKTANANLTGAMGVFQDLHGGNGQMDTISAISDTITKGAQIIADMNSKMLAAVAQMQSGFQTDDYNLLKSAYDTYNSTEKAKSDQIKNMQDEAAQKIKDAQAEKDKQAQIEATKNDAIDNDIRTVMEEAQKGNATPEQLAAMNKALAAHDYAGAVQAAAGTLQDPTSPAGQYSAYVNAQKAAGKPIMAAGDFIAAQKYKESYAAASAAAQAQSAFTSSDKNQSKLEGTYIAGLNKIISSRSGDLGLNAAKVTSAIRAQQLLDAHFKEGKVLSTSQYQDLAMNVANLISGSNAVSDSARNGIQQATAKGDWMKVLSYVSGSPQNATTDDVLKNLQDTVKIEGNTAEISRNQYLTAEPVNSDLDPTRAAGALDHLKSNLPSYNKMSNGDIAYWTPEQIATTAQTNVQDLVTQDPTKAAMVTEMLKVPGATYTTVAQKLGLLPSTQ